jgi:hypothetical protein
VEAFVYGTTSRLYGFHCRLLGCVANEQRNRQKRPGKEAHTVSARATPLEVARHCADLTLARLGEPISLS